METQHPAAQSPAGEVVTDYNPFVEPHRSAPYAFYDWAVREAPLVYSNMMGAYIVTRYDDVIAILKDPRRFSSRHAVPSLLGNPPEVVEILRTSGVPERNMAVNADAPVHPRLRRILSRSMTPERIKAFEPAVRAIAHELIDAFIGQGRAELAEAYVNLLPRMVISMVLGSPRQDIPRVDGWVGDMLTLMNPTAPLEIKLAAARQMVEYDRYVLELIRERRAARRDDILSDLIHNPCEEYEPLSDSELVAIFREQRLAGVDTTRGLIANAILNLMGHPEHWEAVRRDPSKVPAVLEETLRRNSPSRGTLRTTTEDVELRGVQLPKGSHLLLLFGAASRDPAHFSHPEKFDVARENIADHLGFGRGTHFCAGVVLGRLEGRVAIEAIAERLPGLALAPGFEVRYLPSQIFVNIERLDVTF